MKVFNLVGMIIEVILQGTALIFGFIGTILMFGATLVALVLAGGVTIIVCGGVIFILGLFL